MPGSIDRERSEISIAAMKRSRIGWVLIVIIGLSLHTLSAAHHYVSIRASGFLPSTLTIAVGDSVTWISDDWEPHTVTSNSGAWQRAILFEDDTFTLTFPYVGTYSYRDEFDGFTGSIVVTTSSTPVNDQCSGAILMTSGVIYTVNTGTATSTGDPNPSCASTGRGVWYTFTPGASGTVTISTCESDYDTVLAVYTGSCGALTSVANGCNDDSGPFCNTTRASMSFSGVGGTTYRVLVGGYGGSSGTLRIVATWPSSPPPANDQCSGAIPMTPGTLYTQNTTSATSTGDPVTSCAGSLGRGVWYSYTPGASGPVTLSTCGSDFDTVLSVYTGSCGSLVAVPGGCNDDDGPMCYGWQASVTFAATAGTTYRILAGGFGGAGGNLNLVLTAPTVTWHEVTVTYDIGVNLARTDVNLIHLVDRTNDRLLTLDTDTGAFVSSIRLRGKPDHAGLMCVSFDGQFLYVPLYSVQKLQVISLATLETVDVVPLTVAPGSVAAGFDGMLYVIANSQIVRINPVTGQTLGTVGAYFYAPILKSNLSGTRLYMMERGLSGGSAMIDEYTISGTAPPSYVTNHYNGKSNDKDFVVAEDISMLYSTSGGVYGVGAWNMITRAYQYWPYGSAYGAAVAMVPYGTHVYGASGDPYTPVIRKFDRLTGAVAETLDVSGSGRGYGSILDRSLKVTPNEAIFYAREGRKLGLIGPASFTTNLPPTMEVVDAGADRTVVAGEFFELTALAPFASEAEGFLWSQISGPGAVSFLAPGEQATTATIEVAGEYVLEVLRANSAGTGRDRINVTVLPRPIRFDETCVFSNGNFQLRFNSDPGYFVVEATSNFVHWETILNLYNPGGPITVTDPETNHTQRFYRVRRASD